MNKLTFPKEETEFNRWLVREYFRHGSVDEVFRKYRYQIPISYANYQRILNKWGVVKKAGPNSKLTEVLEFLNHIAKDSVSFEELYKKMPPSFQTSASTLYRILAYIKEGVTRRVGTALILTPYNQKDKILLAQDISIPRIELGKPYGSASLPMGYSRKRDSRKVNVIRVLQHEVLTKQTIDGQFPYDIISSSLEPFMYLDIVDVRVAVYHIQLSRELSSLNNFSSFKLKDYHFVSIDNILGGIFKKTLRMGVEDAIRGYQKYLTYVQRNLAVNPLQNQSILNKELATVVVDIEG